MVGVLPEIWLPVMMQAEVTGRGAAYERRGSHFLTMIGRLEQGVSIEQARANMEAVAAQLSEEYPNNNDGKSVTLVPANRNRAFLQMVDDSTVKLFMNVLLGVVGLVLLIACLNVASLLLARATGRRQEIALRLSIGAGRVRVVRQLLTESVLLAALAGILGGGLAYWSLQALASMPPPMLIPINLEFPLDWRVFGFTLWVTLAAGVAFGLAPAMQALNPQLFDALKSKRAAAESRGVGRFQNGLVVAQLGVSLFLLIAAGLCVQSLRNASRLDVGFDPNDAIALNLDASFAQYDEPAGRRLFDDITADLTAIPGVESVGLTTSLPLGLRNSSSVIRPEGYEFAAEEQSSHLNWSVNEDYFEAMRIPVVEGRAFRPQDDADSPRVIIVNEAFAKRFFAGQSAVGKYAQTQGERHEIVGVVKTGKYRTLDEQPRPVYYFPLRQRYRSQIEIALRTSGVDAGSVIPAAVAAIQRRDPKLPVFDVKTLDQHLGFALLPSRMLGVIVGGFGLLALILALVGVYGVMAYSVSRRTQEFGIRTALGGRKQDILSLVMSQGLWITLIGAGIGLVGALAATRVLAGFLMGVGAVDPLTFALVSLLLIAAALAACYAPAARAARVNPMTALRYE